MRRSLSPAVDRGHASAPGGPDRPRLRRLRRLARHRHPERRWRRAGGHRRRSALRAAREGQAGEARRRARRVARAGEGRRRRQGQLGAHGPQDLAPVRRGEALRRGGRDGPLVRRRAGPRVAALRRPPAGGRVRHVRRGALRRQARGERGERPLRQAQRHQRREDRRGSDGRRLQLRGDGAVVGLARAADDARRHPRDGALLRRREPRRDRPGRRATSGGDGVGPERARAVDDRAAPQAEEPHQDRTERRRRGRPHRRRDPRARRGVRPLPDDLRDVVPRRHGLLLPRPRRRTGEARGARRDRARASRTSSCGAEFPWGSRSASTSR